MSSVDVAGVHYVDLGRGPNHSGAIHAGFSSTPEQYHFFKRRLLSRSDVEQIGSDTRQRLSSQLQQGAGSLCVLSGEDMTNLDEGGVRRLVRFVSSRVESVRVIAYVRPPRSFMESAFQQRVKGGLSCLNFAPLYPGYRRRFLKFEQAIGRGKIDLVPFHVNQLVNGDVVADFCSKTGIPSAGIGRLGLNSSLSADAVAMLYTYRKFGAAYGNGPDEIRENKAILRALQSLEGPKLWFQGPLVDEVVARFSNDQKWVERRMEMPLDEPRSEDRRIIRSERDLLTYGESQMAWLRGWTVAVPGPSSASPEGVASSMRMAVPAMVEEFRAARKAERRGPTGASSAGNECESR